MSGITRSLMFGALICGLVTLSLVWSRAARAHCDTLDGPVVTAARVALEKGDVTPVLKWVPKENEEEIRAAFQHARAVRSLNDAARNLADSYFFETLVRIHRAGEGEPYTGLKPAGTVEPIVATADKALETGNVDALIKVVTEAVAAGIRERFTKAVEAKRHAEHTVDAGREFVAAYVTFIHYVERLHRDATSASGEHGEAVEEGAAHKGHQH
ncbi:MAG: DUF6448 family protein [Planctomycetota bacterium]